MDTTKNEVENIDTPQPDAEYILTHPKFDDILKELIAAVTTGRKKPGPGQRYLRTPYDELHERELLTVESVRNEFNLICAQKSRLSAAQRYAIENIVIQTARAIIALDKNKQK